MKWAIILLTQGGHQRWKTWKSYRKTVVLEIDLQNQENYNFQVIFSGKPGNYFLLLIS